MSPTSNSENSVPAASSHPSTLEAWRDIGITAAAFAYLAGWFYIRSYLLSFGVDLSFLEISIQQYLIYGFLAIRSSPVALLALSALVGLRFGLRHLNIGLSDRWLQALLIVVGGLVLTWISIDAGEANAASVRRNFSLKGVSFVFKKDAEEKVPPIIIEANNQGEFRSLLQTKERYVVLWQRPVDPDIPKRLPAAAVFIIASDQVSLAQLRITDIAARGGN